MYVYTGLACQSLCNSADNRPITRYDLYTHYNIEHT
jgi:hypothetical protein